jgi:hypothetical protein
MLTGITWTIFDKTEAEKCRISVKPATGIRESGALQYSSCMCATGAADYDFGINMVLLTTLTHRPHPTGDTVFNYYVLNLCVREQDGPILNRFIRKYSRRPLGIFAASVGAMLTSYLTLAEIDMPMQFLKRHAKIASRFPDTPCPWSDEIIRRQVDPALLHGFIS